MNLTIDQVGLDPNDPDEADLFVASLKDGPVEVLIEGSLNDTIEEIASWTVAYAYLVNSSDLIRMVFGGKLTGNRDYDPVEIQLDYPLSYYPEVLNIILDLPVEGWTW